MEAGLVRGNVVEGLRGRALLRVGCYQEGAAVCGLGIFMSLFYVGGGCSDAKAVLSNKAALILATMGLSGHFWGLDDAHVLSGFRLAWSGLVSVLIHPGRSWVAQSDVGVLEVAHV